ncbi:RNA polymerase II transcriptional regulation [Ordospora colligata]|uniref:Mediator of RNA polymerase II transcription subunit 6 n=1 Tax=Ordospora colligata OC4 TaxID=1354746 RepID=A0A0B2UM91_9MICR|nr:RNA polymerase II transcriptional regulation [Ordospora colligata OC4]KHN70384.1 RNA polymerase II transcriptional regulation [Ordospora colligata OC4]TBU17134.1 RNA polymerase II transcriptional regulation [Ordospora colligata]TBU17384.1 RNA polymerase II transcriptional regulation [Ordospora colligata]TBU19564.1 RNA polymerase II transcriptional regulation [Ordospora colligata]
MEGGEESISFVDQQFLSSRPLDEGNILEYFSGSPFYDKSCNNEILRMQTQFRGLEYNKATLSTMAGIFYEVMSVNTEKTLFIISKTYNHITHVEMLGIYYIMHGYVYSAPTNYSIYRSRMTDSMWMLNSFVIKMMEKKKFNPFSIQRKKQSTSKIEDNSNLGFMMDVFNEFRKSLEPKR